MIRFTKEGKVLREWPCSHGHFGDDCLRCNKELVDALDAAVAALRVARWALREPLDGWKGECERKALDTIRGALRQIGADHAATD